MRLDALFEFVDSLSLGLADWFGREPSRWVELETVDDTQTLVAADGSLVSVIEIFGANRMVGVEEHEAAIGRFVTSLGAWFATSAHALQFTFERDPERGMSVAERAVAGLLGSAGSFDMNDLLAVLSDWGEQVGRLVSVERAFCVVWTRPALLPRATLAEARRERARRMAQAPKGRHAQRFEALLPLLRDRHRAAVQGILIAFREANLVAAALDVHQALRAAREAVDPLFTASDWRPAIPGAVPPLRMADLPPLLAPDLSDLLWPRLGEQLFPRDVQKLGGGDALIRVGERVHAPVLVTLPPQHPKPFNVLFRQLLDRNLPWRFSMLIEGGGLRGKAVTNFLATLLKFTSGENRMYDDAMQQLKRRGLSEPIIRLRMVADTWGRDEGEARRHMNILAQALQSWGSCETGVPTGAGLWGFSATVPALSCASPAPSAAAPLHDALFMAPISRPASPWQRAEQEGHKSALPFRSPDGKMMPWTPGSALQASWIELGVAPMGSSKSVTLNTINLGFLLAPGIEQMPWLTVIDIGPSSSGLIDLLRETLPAHRRHYAAYHRLRMTEAFAINPCDTPLGCRRPLPSHRAFLVNLLCLLCTPLDATAPPEGIAGLAAACVERAYDTASDDRNPRPYAAGLDGEVDALVGTHGLAVDGRTSWWEITDQLFRCGEVHTATRAQRFAVPLIADIALEARSSEIGTLYDFTTLHGERVVDYFWRKLTEAVEAYPILHHPTRFDLGEARVISLDLDEVAPRGGAQADRQTAVVYMLARHVGVSRFFLMDADVPLMHPLYREFHAVRVEQMRTAPKRWASDEVHRFLKNDAVRQQVESDMTTTARESRKWNLHMGLYTQELEDIPDTMIELATTIYIFGAGTETGARRLGARLGLTETATAAITRLGKPGAAGAHFIAYWKADGATSMHVITNTIGPLLLWALSTTTEDVRLRRRLVEKLGFLAALRLLARRFPAGVKAEVERRRAGRAELAQQPQADDGGITAELLEELLASGRA